MQMEGSKVEMLTNEQRNRAEAIRTLSADGKHQLQVLLNTQPVIEPHNTAIKEAIDRFDKAWSEADLLVKI